MSATCWPWPGPGDVFLCRRGGSRDLGWRRSGGSGVSSWAWAAATPRTGTQSQPWAPGREENHPLQGAEHTPSSPCGRGEGHRAQQEYVPNLLATAAQDCGDAAGALQVVGEVEHTSEEQCVLRRLQPGRSSTGLWPGTSSSLLPWESRHHPQSFPLARSQSVAILILVALFGSNYLCTVKSKPCPGPAVLPGARAWQQA